ncbi:MAG: hypothetical protein QOF50_820 [Gaiellaceae bacterium]|nr:hypothetical protein [Gaiellaceae bacterium]
MQKIPLVDVKAQYAPLIPELQQRFAQVLEDGQFVLGPNRCTGMIALVRAEIRRSTSSGSRLYVAGSISAKTGMAPRRAIA